MKQVEQTSYADFMSCPLLWLVMQESIISVSSAFHYIYLFIDYCQAFL